MNHAKRKLSLSQKENHVCIFRVQDLTLTIITILVITHTHSSFDSSHSQL